MRNVVVAYTLVFVILFVNTPLVTQPRLPDQVKQAKNALSEINPLNEINSSITILSDMDFMSQNFPGNGSLTNPFIIENQRIESDEACIRIENTRSHFMIRNCHFWHRMEYTWHQPEDCCIYFENVTFGNITDCYIESSWEYGIIASDCHNLSIFLNLLRAQIDQTGRSHVDIGFHFIDSSFLSITNNTMAGFPQSFVLWNCSNYLTENNLVCEETCGVDKSGPTIIHSKRSDYTITMVGPILGKEFSAEITDGNGVDCVFLYYRLSQNDSYTRIKLGSLDPEYELWIDFELENPYILDLWYFYWANDSFGNWRVTPVDFWFLYSGSYPNPTTHTTNTTPNTTITQQLFLIIAVGSSIVVIIVLVRIYNKRE